MPNSIRSLFLLAIPIASALAVDLVGPVRAANSSDAGAAFIAQPFSGSANEGGQIDLNGAGSNPIISLDNFFNSFRVFSGGNVWFFITPTGISSKALTLTANASIVGPVVIGTDPGGSDALRVGGSAKFSGPLLASGNTGWIGLMAGSTRGTDVVVSGNLTTSSNKVYGATIGAHNATLSAWAKLSIQPEGSSNVTICEGSTGNVGIGVSSPSQRLVVNGNANVIGKVTAQEVVVQQAVPADYVFETDYKLRSLDEVEAFVLQKKHLPGIPSAAQIVKDGVPVGDMMQKQMEKIEELTLYVIMLNKENVALRAMMIEQQDRINTRLKQLGAASLDGK